MARYSEHRNELLHFISYGEFDQLRDYAQLN